MHPSRAIRGRTTHLLDGKHLLIGISGSIAAIEVPKIIRELLRHGAQVDAVMSPEATRIITAEAVHFATGRPPILQLTGNVEHVTLLGPGEGRVDLLLIAPATANTISKIAHGIDDTPVTSCASVALGGRVPMLLAPAMHGHMMLNPALQENLERLRGWGVGIIPGASVEGEEKIASPEEIAAAVLHRLAAGAWKGRKVVVIGGAGREAIDEVRSVTNESSGASAIALANQAHFRGAEVELWAGAMQTAPPPWTPTFPWRGVEDLRALARRRRSVPEGGRSRARARGALRLHAGTRPRKDPLSGPPHAHPHAPAGPEGAARAPSPRSVPDPTRRLQARERAFARRTAAGGRAPAERDRGRLGRGKRRAHDGKPGHRGPRAPEGGDAPLDPGA